MNQLAVKQNHGQHKLLCLFQRPTAKELLKHKFILKNAKKTSYLTELIDRFKRWKAEGHSSDETDSDGSDS